LLGSWAPTPDHIRERVSSDIGVDIIVSDECAIAGIMICAAIDLSIFFVGSQDDVTIFGQTDRFIPVISSVERVCRIPVEGSLRGHAIVRILTEGWGFSLVPEAIVFNEAGTPEMIMEITLGSGMATADIQALTFILYSIAVLTIQGIVDYATRKSNASHGAEGGAHATATTAIFGRGLEHATG